MLEVSEDLPPLDGSEDDGPETDLLLRWDEYADDKVGLLLDGGDDERALLLAAFTDMAPSCPASLAVLVKGERGASPTSGEVERAPAGS